MPKKKKEAAKQVVAPPPPPPPPRMVHGVKDPILSTGPPKDYEDWKIKNAKAKELIMSTLVPGSEPWKIAEPFEDAADIWKALEKRYAPHRSVEQQEDPAESSASAATTGENPSQASGFVKFWDVQNFYTALPSRDQRLLWAILYGGTPEAEKWFSSSTNTKK